MKKLLVLLLAAVTAAACFCGCAKEDNTVSEKSDNSKASVSMKKNETFLEKMSEGDTEVIKDSEVYTYFDQNLTSVTGFLHQYVTVKNDCEYGKKGQTVEHIYNAVHPEEGEIIYKPGGSYDRNYCYAMTYINYDMKKKFFYNPKYDKSFSVDHNKDYKGYVIEFLPDDVNEKFVVHDGWYVYTCDNNGEETTYRYCWDEGAIRFELKQGKRLVYDITVSYLLSGNDIGYLGKSDMICVLDAQEIKAPDIVLEHDGDLRDVNKIVDSSMDEYWKTAELVEKNYTNS